MHCELCIEIMSINSTVNKLTLLFVFDKLDFPILEDSLLNICSNANAWVTWMECKETLSHLLKTGLIHQSFSDKKIYYRITPDGRQCLMHFYGKIPASIRSDISEYIKANRVNFKRRQEYMRDYFQNEDGSYTVALKIQDINATSLEIRLSVPTRAIAKQIHNKWEDKASQVYYMLHEQLVD